MRGALERVSSATLEVAMFLGIFAAVWLLACRGIRLNYCRAVGHQPMWVLGAACGFTRPVCKRCRTQL